ncbi:uncharacterized protein V6R79_024993 [Siganus canaliculatus]
MWLLLAPAAAEPCPRSEDELRSPHWILGASRGRRRSVTSSDRRRCENENQNALLLATIAAPRRHRSSSPWRWRRGAAMAA